MRTNPCNQNLTKEMEANGYRFVPTKEEQIVFQSEWGGTASFCDSQAIREFLDDTYAARRELEDETRGALGRAGRAPRIDFYATDQDVPPVWAIEPEMIMNPNENGYEKFAEECEQMKEQMNALAESGKMDMRLVSVCGSEAYLDFGDKLSITRIKQRVSHESGNSVSKQRKSEISR